MARYSDTCGTTDGEQVKAGYMDGLRDTKQVSHLFHVSDYPDMKKEGVGTRLDGVGGHHSLGGDFKAYTTEKPSRFENTPPFYLQAIRIS